MPQLTPNTAKYINLKNIHNKYKVAQWEITSLLLERPPSKRQAITNRDKDAEKRGPLCIVGQNVNGYNQYGKDYGVCSKNEN